MYLRCSHRFAFKQTETSHRLELSDKLLFVCCGSFQDLTVVGESGSSCVSAKRWKNYLSVCWKQCRVNLEKQIFLTLEPP